MPPNTNTKHQSTNYRNPKKKNKKTTHPILTISRPIWATYANWKKGLNCLDPNRSPIIPLHWQRHSSYWKRPSWVRAGRSAIRRSWSLATGRRRTIARSSSCTIGGTRRTSRSVCSPTWLARRWPIGMIYGGWRARIRATTSTSATPPRCARWSWITYRLWPGRSSWAGTIIRWFGRRSMRTSRWVVLPKTKGCQSLLPSPLFPHIRLAMFFSPKLSLLCA